MMIWFELLYYSNEFFHIQIVPTVLFGKIGALFQRSGISKTVIIVCDIHFHLWLMFIVFLFHFVEAKFQWMEKSLIFKRLG